jgi:superfamily II DNA/RNA helicase
MPDPVYIEMATAPPPAEGVRQYYVNVDREQWKHDTLCDVFHSIEFTQAAVFCNTPAAVDRLAQPESLANFGFPAEQVRCIHAQMSQAERAAALHEYRSGAFRLLICDHTVSRGIDITVDFQQCQLVVLYDMPASAETYVQSVGRLGRFGRYARRIVSIVFLTSDDAARLTEIEQFYNVAIEELPDDVFELL